MDRTGAKDHLFDIISETHKGILLALKGTAWTDGGDLYYAEAKKAVMAKKENGLVIGGGTLVDETLSKWDAVPLYINEFQARGVQVYTLEKEPQFRVGLNHLLAEARQVYPKTKPLNAPLVTKWIDEQVTLKILKPLLIATEKNL